MDLNIVGAEPTIEHFEEAKLWFENRSIGQVAVVVSAPYAGYVEFGTSKMRAQPYLIPAIRRVVYNADEYLDGADSLADFEKQLAEGIADEAQKRAPVDTGRLMNSISVREL